MLIDHVAKREDPRVPRQWTEKAVALAMENRWSAAVDLNRRILTIAPNDVSALNRLGRALMELGQYEEARDAYQTTLAHSPSNSIAQQNLSRMAALQEAAPSVAPVVKVAPQMFLAEPGKATTTSIKLRGKASELAKVAIGEQVELVVNGRALWVRDSRGTLLGAVEQRLALRIIALMKGGNRYDAALVGSAEDAARVVIRETYQDVSQLGKVSFPALEGTASSPGVLHNGVANDEVDDDEEEAEADEVAEDMGDTAPSVEEEAASRSPRDDGMFV